MRKSRIRNNSKTGTKRNNKFSGRKYKTRKHRGGTIQEDGFTLVGFLNDRPSPLVGPFIPIFLFNNMEYNVKQHNKFSDLIPPNKHYGSPFRFSHIILPQLYKLKKIRGLSLVQSLRDNMYFYDENGNPVIDNTFVPPENYPLQIYFSEPRFKNVIREVELKYPGLFGRMFITPEEEQEALREIERKEQEQKIQATLIGSKIEATTGSKMEADTSSTGLTEEEKGKIIQDEMEAWNRITPYLKADLKNKRKNKLSRKRIEDTAVTIGNMY